MPVIRFTKNIPELNVEHGANLMESLLSANLPVASSCLGDGVCAKCRIIINEGAANLSPINATEKMLRDRLKIPKEYRISCQTHVEGDIKVDATYW